MIILIHPNHHISQITVNKLLLLTKRSVSRLYGDKIAFLLLLLHGKYLSSLPFTSDIQHIIHQPTKKYAAKFAYPDKNIYLCTRQNDNRVRTIVYGISFFFGEMAEWSIAAVLKTVEGHTSGGSNPSLSAET